MKVRCALMLQSIAKFPIPSKLRSLFKLPESWNLRTLVKVTMIGLVLVLIAMLLFKPSVDSAFHEAYLANLNELEALGGELHRDHLLVRQGLVRHYDFIEADLEQMERSAALALFYPDFVSAEFELQLRDLITSYQSDLMAIRKQVDVSKQSIGLLMNAQRALRQFLGDLNAALVSEPDRAATSLLLELEYALIYKDLDADWLLKVEQLDSLRPDSAAILRPLLLHARMINVQQIELAEASHTMYALLGSLIQPEELKSVYLEQLYSTMAITSRLLWLSYAAVTALLALCIGLVFSSDRARAIAQSSVLQAQQAQLESDRWLIQTHLAVTQCNEVLECIGRGEFDQRLEFPFDETLEILRESINQTADSVEFTMTELNRVMLAVREGRFDVRLSSRVEGTLGVQVDETISSLDTAIGDICQVMDDMREGCFSKRVDVECMGRLDELKSSVNDSMSVLDAAICDVVGLVRHQAEGDFTRTIKVAGKGQLALLATSINSSSARVHEMVREIRQVSETVELSSETMKGNSHTLCEHTAIHSESVSSLLEKVDMVKGAIQINCKSVGNATGLVGRSQEEAGEGMRIANEAVSFMHNINEKSLKIATISGVLDTIARQTKLLALNAAVEAVRAGEMGAGFSVVANEVKDLARQSAAASTDITELITATMHDIRQGAESVENTGQALQAISNSILDVEKISQLIVEQSYGQEDDMDSIVSIVNQTRQIITEDLEMAKGISETSENLGMLVQRVNQLLSFFQTEGQDSGNPSYQAEGQTPLSVEEQAVVKAA